ncbi:hypothetical protein A2U01_0105105, partial [Trifolium medium]|nr:hypothetical protein [Trifolium medium]
HRGRKNSEWDRRDGRIGEGEKKERSGSQGEEDGGKSVGKEMALEVEREGVRVGEVVLQFREEKAKKGDEGEGG